MRLSPPFFSRAWNGGDNRARERCGVGCHHQVALRTLQTREPVHAVGLSGTVGDLALSVKTQSLFSVSNRRSVSDRHLLLVIWSWLAGAGAK